MRNRISSMLMLMLICFISPPHQLSAAFENIQNGSVLLDNELNPGERVSVSFGAAVWASFPFLNLYQLEYINRMKKLPVKLSVVTTGDKLYNENMVYLRTKLQLSNQLISAIKLSIYKLSILHYNSIATISLGISSTYFLTSETTVSIRMANIHFLTSAKINRDISKQGEILIRNKSLPNQEITYSVVQEFPYPIDHRVFWNSTVNSYLSVIGGYTSFPQTCILGTTIRYNQFSLTAGTTYHRLFGNILSIMLIYFVR